MKWISFSTFPLPGIISSANFTHSWYTNRAHPFGSVPNPLLSDFTSLPATHLKWWPVLILNLSCVMVSLTLPFSLKVHRWISTSSSSNSILAVPDPHIEPISCWLIPSKIRHIVSSIHHVLALHRMMHLGSLESRQFFLEWPFLYRGTTEVVLWVESFWYKGMTRFMQSMWGKEEVLSYPDEKSFLSTNSIRERAFNSQSYQDGGLEEE